MTTLDICKEQPGIKEPSADLAATASSNFAATAGRLRSAPMLKFRYAEIRLQKRGRQQRLTRKIGPGLRVLLRSVLRHVAVGGQCRPKGEPGGDAARVTWGVVHVVGTWRFRGLVEPPACC